MSETTDLDKTKFYLEKFSLWLVFLEIRYTGVNDNLDIYIYIYVCVCVCVCVCSTSAGFLPQ